MKRISIALFLLFSIINHQVFALSSIAATLGSVLAAFPITWATFNLHNRMEESFYIPVDYQHDDDDNSRHAFIKKAGVYVGTAVALRLFLELYTPSGRYRKALTRMREMDNVLIAQKMNDYNYEHILRESGCYDGFDSIPLIIAVKKLNTYVSGIAKIKRLLNKAMRDEAEGTVLYKAMSEAYALVSEWEKTVRYNIYFLKSRSEWLDSVALYNKNQAA